MDMIAGKTISSGPEFAIVVTVANGISSRHRVIDGRMRRMRIDDNGELFFGEPVEGLPEVGQEVLIETGVGDGKNLPLVRKLGDAVEAQRLRDNFLAVRSLNRTMNRGRISRPAPRRFHAQPRR